MDGDKVIQHLSDALNLSKELFLVSIPPLLSEILKKNIKFTITDKYDLLQLVVKCSVEHNVSLNTGVFKDIIDFLNWRSTYVKNVPSTSSALIEETENSIVQCGYGNENGEKFTLISKYNTFFKKFNVQGVKMTFQLKNFNKSDGNPLEWLENVFDGVIKEVISNSDAGGKISFSIFPPNSPQIKPIWSSLRPIDQLNGNYIVGLISNVK